jgi:UDP-N-acetylmuramyl pentapeptide phosphotransferase/UDP-N-acetylglucosamine-1-phosphate transferase
LVDDPKLHKHPGIIHTKPVPRGGGIPLFVGALIAGLFFYLGQLQRLPSSLRHFLALVIGVIDDKLNAQSKDVSPYLRFLIQYIDSNYCCGQRRKYPVYNRSNGRYFTFGCH